MNPDDAAPDRRPRVRPGVGSRARAGSGVWLVGAAFALGIGVSAIPTPLYTLYAARDGFGPGTVTLVFAAFSAAVSLTLVTLGPVSDRAGRRRTLVSALLLDGVSCVVFILWPALPGLIAARVICGIAVGGIAATATAYMAELHARAALHRMRQGPEFVATAANLGGVGIGALAAGFAAQFAPRPLQLTYEIYLVLLLVVAALVARLPDVGPGLAAGDGGPPGSRPVVRSRWRYRAAAGGALLAMTTLGLFASLVPSFLATALHDPSRALAGAVACVAFISAALGQTVLQRLSPRAGLLGGYGGMAGGLAMMTIGLWTHELVLCVSSGLTAGGGAGLVFKRCLAIAAEPPVARSRARSLAGVYLAAYLGLALAIVGLGVSTSFVGDRVALLVFAAAACAAIGCFAAISARCV